MKTYSGDYWVVGPPGTGKTTWLTNQVEAIVSKSAGIFAGGSPVIVSSLTRAAAAEVAGRETTLPAEAIATLHGHAYRSQDCPKLISSAQIHEFNERYRWLAVDPGVQDVDDPVGNGLPSTLEFHGQKDRELYELSRHRLEPLDRYPTSVSDFAVRWESFKAEIGAIDFTDMIEDADDKPPMNPEVVIVDEAQDMSALEWRLVRRWANAAGCLISVGDPDQALFTWRGASANYISSQEPKRTKTLSRSWRIPRSVHKAATNWIFRNGWAPAEFTARDDDGTVEEIPGVWKFPESILQRAVEAAANSSTVIIAATCGYMLAPICGELKKRGEPFSNPWRRKQGLWNPLGPRTGTSTTKRLASLLNPPVRGRLWTVTELQQWIPMIRSNGLLRHKAKERLADEPEPDRLCTFDFLLGLFDPDGFIDFHKAWESNDLSRWISGRTTARFSSRLQYPLHVVATHGIGALEREPRIHVGTIHSFKGGEADTVFLFPNLSPGADQAYHDIGENKKLIVRTFYVGMTRARKSLYLCHPSGRHCINWNIR